VALHCLNLPFTVTTALLKPTPDMVNVAMLLLTPSAVWVVVTVCGAIQFVGPKTWLATRTQHEHAFPAPPSSLPSRRSSAGR
jgi:hypothetical protein